MTVCVCVLLLFRCGVSAQVLEGDLGATLGEALVGLPAEVKVVGSETDNVVPLEELAMRTLHRIYHQRPTGGELHMCYICTQHMFVWLIMQGL